MQNFSTIIDQIAESKLAFLAAFFLIFTTSYGVLYAVDFYPEPVKTTEVKQIPLGPVATTTAKIATTTNVVTVPTTTVSTTTSAAKSTKNVDNTPVSQNIGSDTLPGKLTIDALDRTVTVLNPASNSIASLDAALEKGVIRHPDSATFAQEGNMFILGHSSYLPTVHNRNFQALNGIQNLKWGDTIKLSSDNTEYVYKVEKVYKAKASAVTVPVKGKGKTLTIATCNSFGSTDDRYIVEATLTTTRTI